MAAHRQAPERRSAQRALARELTELVHGAGGRRAPPTRRPRCSSVATRWRPSAGGASTVVRRRGRRHRGVAGRGARRPGGPARPRPAWPRPTATPGARSSQRGFRANGAPLASAGDVAAGPASPRRSLPAPAQGQDHLPRGRTCPSQVDAAWAAPVESSFAPERPLPGLGWPIQHRRCRHRVPVERWSLLDNGREDGTPVRALPPAGISPDRSRRYTHQFQSRANPPRRDKSTERCRGG